MRNDEQWMAQALALAQRGLGRTWPNPTVGCVVVAEGRLIGLGWTQPGGKPHAETQALERAKVAGLGAALRGATAYVTLEPCAHHGKTPPCADALIAAGIARVVCATEDPDPRMRGAGFERLRAAGIAVTIGPGAAQAADINAGFFMHLTAKRPLLSLKLATSLDGRIALASGQSRWITGEMARQHGHMQRAQHDGLMIGIGTVLADDPMLDCRLPGYAGRQPVRIVIDGKLRLLPSTKLVKSARQQPLWLFTGPIADKPAAQALREAGVELIEIPVAAGRPDLAACLRVLGERGMTRVLAEGGAKLAASLLEADLVDRLAWYRAPSVLGADAAAGVAPLHLDRLAEAKRFRRAALQMLGGDVLETLVRHH